jgi:hypothetical protein
MDAKQTQVRSSALEDIPVPPRWRALLPSRIRMLVWGDDRESYDGFLSYSWEADHSVAPVLQSVLQNFLRPWYKVRTLNIFRDLSSLPANQNLREELAKRLDRSKHLIVLASPQAATSGGMAFEAEHWLSIKRDGHILVVVTSGNYPNWDLVREEALPAPLRPHLQSPPLWIDLSRQRDDILKRPADPRARVELEEHLKQLILAFHPHRSWSELRGEERAQKRRALGLTAAAVAAVAFTLGFGYYQTKVAELQTKLAQEAAQVAEAQQNSLSADALLKSDPSALGLATNMAVEGVVKHANPFTEGVLRSALSLLPPLLADVEVPCRPIVGAIDPTRRYLALGGDGSYCIVDLAERRVVLHITLPEVLQSVVALYFTPDGALLVAHKRVAGETRIQVLAGPYWKETHEAPLPARVSVIALAPDATWIAAGTENGEVLLTPWPSNPDGLVRRLAEKRAIHQEIGALAFDRSGRYLLVGSQARLEIWRDWAGERPALVLQLTFRKDAMPSLLKSAPVVLDSERDLFAVAHSGFIDIYRLSAVAKVQSIAFADVDALIMSSGGWLTAHSSNGWIKVWTRHNQEFVPESGVGFARIMLAGELTTSKKLETSMSGEYVVAVHEKRSSVQQWASLLSVRSGEEIARFYHGHRIWQFFSLGPGSSSVTAGDDHRVRIWGNILERQGRTRHSDGEPQAIAVDGAAAQAVVGTAVWMMNPAGLEFWSLDPSRLLRSTLRGNSKIADIRAMQFDPVETGSVLVATSSELWKWRLRDDESSPEKQMAFPALGDRCFRHIAFADQKGLIAVSGGRGELWVGPQGSLRRLPKLGLPVACVESVALSADGSHLAASFLHSVFVIALDQASLPLRIATQYLVRSMAFGAGGRVLVLATGLEPESTYQNPSSGLEIWSVDQGRRIVQEDLRGDSIFHNVCINQEGTLVGTAQGAIGQVWDFDPVAERLSLRITEALVGAMTYCRFSIDSRKFVVGDPSGVRVIPLRTEDLIGEARRRLTPGAITQ